MCKRIPARDLLEHRVVAAHKPRRDRRRTPTCTRSRGRVATRVLLLRRGSASALRLAAWRLDLADRDVDRADDDRPSRTTRTEQKGVLAARPRRRGGKRPKPSPTAHRTGPEQCARL